MSLAWPKIKMSAIEVVNPSQINIFGCEHLLRTQSATEGGDGHLFSWKYKAVNLSDLIPLPQQDIAWQ